MPIIRKTVLGDENGNILTFGDIGILLDSQEGSYIYGYEDYLAKLRTDFVKIAKLEFLNADGTIAFALDNNAKNQHSGAFIQDGNLTVNLNNGKRRQATVTLANLDNAFLYDVSHIWFGTQLRLSMGVLMDDGSEYYIPQGVFEIEQPTENYNPNLRTMQYQLVDKWANLDGTLLGNLEGAYKVEAGTNIFTAMDSIRRLGRYDMGNDSAYPIDNIAPIYTNYYNNKTQTLTDGSVVSLIDAPYDYLSDDSGTLADVMVGLSEMLAAWIGYNAAGRLVVDPSQDDIEDISKPVLWTFRPTEKQFLGATYVTKPADIYNDVIVVGDTNDNNYTPYGRAQNLDPSSDTCVSRIGLKTKRISMSNYYSNDICEAYAEWQLKRYATVSKSITIKSTQMFHLSENSLVEIERPDKEGSPIERHLIQGYTLPIGQTGEMTINAISTQDYPTATIIN